MDFKRITCIALVIFASNTFAAYEASPSTFAFADLLVWQLREGGPDSWAQEISPSGAVQTVNLVAVPFNWKSGYRIGVGRNWCYDAWDTVFSYTYYHVNASKQSAMTTGMVSSPFVGNFFVNNTDGASITLDPAYRNGGVQWKFYFNTFDLDLGRNFRINNFLKLRPFIGLKAAIINQNIYTFWRNPTNAVNFTNATENLKNDFWGVGPAVGLNSTWALCKTSHNTFNLIGNFSGALLWGNWRFQDVYSNNIPKIVSVNVSAISGASSMARGLLGLEWIRCCGRAKFSMRIGYEAQVWFDQVQFYSYSMGRLNNLLSLQGGVFGVGLNF